MRIQHNLAALNAYRQLGNNNSALSKNLEKLSSGYRINRAGDDAAGLAISEKMRAQIKGLEAAQKNANDGISLVQTAEGALTEVHSMLNRMTYLATQSANGTYDNDVDRANLQAEVDSLLEEIDRISKSTNFNGLNLLDGSMDSKGSVVKGGEQTDVPIITDVATDPTNEVGEKTVLHGDAVTATKTSFEVDFHDTVVKGAAGDKLEVKIGGETFELEFKVGATAANGELEADTEISGEDLANAIKAKFDEAAGQNKLIDGQAFETTVDGTKIKFEQAAVPADQTEVVDPDMVFDLTLKPAGGAGGGTFTAGTPAAGTQFTGTVAGVDLTGTPTDTLNAGDAAKIKALGTVKIGGVDVDLSGLTIDDTSSKQDAIDAVKQAVEDAFDTANTAGAAGTANYTQLDTVVVTATNNGFTVDFQETAQTYTPAAAGDSSQTGTINVGTINNVKGAAAAPGQLASTTFDLTEELVKDGATITIGKETYTFKVGADSKVADGTANVIDLSKFEDGDAKLLEAAREKLSQQNNTVFTIGYDKATQKMSIHEKVGNTEFLDELKTQAGFDSLVYANKATDTTPGKALVLQVGDTSEDFQKVSLDIKDMSTKGLGINGLSIGTQEDAADAIKKIKDAINTVSSQRGDLGAIQNRLEHTINNLGVQAENITAAESRIRDTDMAEEMMAYTKNNILVQAAQAMLAQANQVPQGILQLLQ